MAISILLLAGGLLAPESLQTDFPGKQRVSPSEREREARALSLLQDAEVYYRSELRDNAVAIEKFENVLREVDLHPGLREDILLRLAGLCDQVNPAEDRRTVSREARLNKALRYYGEVVSSGADETRPLLRADTLLRMGDIYRVLGKSADAVYSFLQARNFARDQSLPACNPGILRRRSQIEHEALSRVVTELSKPLNRRIRDRVIDTNSHDMDLMRALSRTSDASGETEPAIPASGLYRAGLAFASGTCTIALIMAMRKGAQHGPLENT